MADRISTFTIAFDGDAGAFQKTIGSLKASLTQTVRDLETLTNKADLFAKTEESAKAAAESFKKTTDAAALLKTQIDKINASGGKVGDDLAKQFTAASKAADTAGKVYDKQVTTVAKLQKVLATAGFDTANFAKSQADLAKQTALASAALTLNLKSAQTIAPELAKAAAAFNTLKTQGGLSFGELSGAAAALKTKQDELKGSTLTLGSAFSSIKTEIIALGASFAVVGVAIKDSIQAAREFSNAMGALKSIAGASQSTLDALAQGARDVALEFGGNAVEGVKALRDIISQGIPADNALSVLQASAAAAEASFTDLGTTARLSTTLINAFGISATDLSGQLDKIFAAAKDGGASLGDLAGSLGELGPLAKTAGIPLGDLVAAIQTLRKAGIDTPTAIMGLNKTIVAFSAPTEAAALRAHELGINLGGLVETIKSIGEKGLAIDQLKTIIPDARSLKIVAALVGNFQGLNAEIQKLDGAAGTIKKTNDELQNTPGQKIKEFRASVEELSISIGQFVDQGVKLLSVLTDVVNAFNKLPTAAKDVAFEITAIVGGFAALFISIRTLQIPINILASALPGLKSGFGGLITGIDAATLAMSSLAVATAAYVGYQFGEVLAKYVPAVRTFGDVLGTGLGAIVTDLGLRLDALKAKLSGNTQGFRDAKVAIAENIRQFAVDYSAAISDAAAKIVELTAKQRELQGELAKTSDAAAKAGANLTTAIGALVVGVDQKIAAVNTNISVIAATLQGLVASITAASQAAQAAATQELTNINADAAAQIAALDQTNAKELATTQARIDIETKAAADRLAVLNKSSADILAILDKESAARLAIVQRNANDTSKVEAEILALKQSTLQKIVDQYRAQITALEAIDQGHLSKIKALEDQRAALNASTEDKIRSLYQQGLTARQAYDDKLYQIDELLSKARDALDNNNLKQAEDFAKRADGLIAGISTQVTEGGKTIVTGYNAQTIAAGKYSEEQGILNGVIDKRILKEQDGAKATKDSLDNSTTALGDYQKLLDKATKDSQTAIIQKFGADTTAVTAELDKLDNQLDKKLHFTVVKDDLDKVVQLGADLADNIAKGITGGTKGALDTIKTKLDDIVKAAPELKINTTAADKAIADVQKSVKALEDVNLKITSNAAEVQTQVNKLGENRTIILTYIARLTGDKIPGGGTINTGTGGVAAGDPGATGLNLGGLVGRFARGGSVFTGRKVPGYGDADTYGANLENGAFVLRKSASKYYGDGLLAKIARFSIGGWASPQNPLIGYYRNGAPPAGATAASYSPTDYDNRVKIIVDAERLLSPIMDGARTLPRSSWGLNMIDYLDDVLSAMRSAVTAAEAQSIFATVGPYLQNFMDAVTNSHTFHVPAVMGLDASSAPDPYKNTSIPSGLYQALTQNLIGGRFAKGGKAGDDTVPALLTPGEWVINREAVSKVGTGFMRALNSMQIPREALARMIEPPRVHRFAEGGPVPGLTSSSMVAAVRERSTTTNIRVSGEGISEWFTESNVRRYVKPILENLNRRSR